MFIRRLVPLGAVSVFALILGLWSSVAQAVPSFARQTGLACAACHTVAPQLNAFGRYFKLHGYVLGPDKLSGGNKKLSIDKFPPLSAMAIASYSRTNEPQPDSQNNDIQFPQELSMFYAGAVSQHMGAFVQLTYEEAEDHFSMDNADIRYARDATWWGKSAVWGFTLNNSPSVQDVWNSTPTWGFPFLGSSTAPGTNAAPLLVDGLGQQVVGLGAYAWWDNSWYAEGTFYRSSQVGSSQPFNSGSENIISGVAPYWRVAWEHTWGGAGGQHDLEIGALGMRTHVFPGGGAPLAGPTNDFTDVGADVQYQYFHGNDSMTVHGLYVHENQDWNAGGTTNASDHLNFWKVDANYYWDNTFGPTIAYFNTSGSSDPMLYPAGALDGSANGSPDSNGWILQWTWLPSLNVQLTAQYIIYNKFNGATDNYDGAGRNASDNNTLYTSVWFLF